MSARFAEKEFQEMVRLNPCWSSYTCFAEIVRSRKLSKRVIKRYFEKVVDGKDYSKTDKSQIINFLYELSSSSA